MDGAAKFPMGAVGDSQAGDLYATQGAKRPLYLDGILFVDEHCEQCVLGGAGHNGGAGKWEVRWPVKDGRYCPVSKGGKYPDPCPTTVPKKPATASGCFGVCAPTVLGKRSGQVMEPISYTGRIVVGIKAFNKVLETEKARVRAMEEGQKGGKSAWAGYSGPNPYEERYGPDWKKELRSYSGVKKYVCVTELMDQVIDQGNKLFKGSTREKDWMIYHDRLPQWWEKESQEYMASRGFEERQVRAFGETNAIH